MRKLETLLLLAAMAVTTASNASTKLLSGSIDFNEPSLWGKQVMTGLDDEGSYGKVNTHWYLDNEASDLGMILQKVGTVSGYLKCEAPKGAVHRTIKAVQDSTGQDITTGGIYIDTVVTLTASSSLEVEKTSEEDKIIAWIYAPGGSSPKFVLTAGEVDEKGNVTAKNYMTEIPSEVISIDSPVQLTMKATYGTALPDGSAGVGFEVWLDGYQATHDGGNTFFPSMRQSSAMGPARKLHSVGFSGTSLVDKINFTNQSPIENPNYDVEDVSMLRESVSWTVSGYPSTSDSLTNFPLLVRISEERIHGFYYDRASSDGSDLRFTDQNGALLPCEVDTWNPDGESLVWVKMPFLKNGVKITMHWALAKGASAPRNDTRAVWSDYAAVWHFSDAAKGSCKDSTGNGYAGFIEGGAVKLADSSAIGSAGLISGGDLVSPSHKDDLENYSRFTFTAWYGASEAISTNLMFAGTKNSSSAIEDLAAFVAADGWGMYFANDYTRPHWVGTGKDSVQIASSVQTGWRFFGAVFGSNADGVTGLTEYYEDGGGFQQKVLADSGYKASASEANFMMAANGMLADELRISKKARSAVWMKAEYDQANAVEFVTPGAATPKDNENYWVKEPNITPNAWTPDEAQIVVVDMGQPRFGFSRVMYYGSKDEEYSVLPTTTGSYKAIFTAGDGTVHGYVTKTVYFSIYDSNGYSDAGGCERTMLFNSDYTPDAGVDMQGYWDVTDDDMEVWEHTGDDWKGTGNYVQDGNFHKYFDPTSGKQLWEFRNARIGNLFQSRYQKLEAGYNMLPWCSGYASRYDDSEKAADNQRYAGWLILQNINGDDPAGAYSPFYTNGLGTVYFDAINTCAAYTNAVKVQVCLTEVEDGGSVTGGVWKTVPLTVLAVEEGVYNNDKTVYGTEEALLAVTRSQGTTNWLYRIRAYIDSTKGMRFRIIRCDNNWSVGGADGDGLIAIDNIIASEPSLGINISQLGEDADPSDRTFRGQKAPFDIAFPAVKDLGAIHPMAKVTGTVDGEEVAVDGSYVGSLTCRYRWRYLEQVVSDWADLQLTVSADDPKIFVSADPIVGQGMGDIEYKFIGVVNAPYYNYVDYTGLKLHWPDSFTERRADIEISAEKDGVYSKSNLSPALGTDYFIRLREGRSPYEGFKLRIRRDDKKNVADEVIAMELVGEGTWRGFYATPTNITDGVLWQVEGFNRQEKPGEYAHNQIYYKASDTDSFPYSGTLDICASNDFARVPCDAVTGYIMVQIEEGTLGVSVIHADHQDFNSWTDANLADGDVNGHFVGTCATNAPNMSGVSVKAKAFECDFKRFSETVATNKLWQESFDLTPPAKVHEGTDKWAIENYFGTMTTPNGWSAESGMWVPEAFRVLGGDSQAFQMQGEGYGKLRFGIDTPAPRGIESFNYRARVAQSYDIYSFNYFRGTNDYYKLQDYTFVVPCAMKRRRESDFEGVGVVSAVANYDDGRGCYEARVERVSTNSYRVCIYKWTVNGYQFSSTLVAKSEAEFNFLQSGLGGQSEGGAEGYGALFISCQNDNDSVLVQAGVKTTLISSPTAQLSGSKYNCVSYLDETSTQHTCGTFGVGSRNCPAFFVSPRLYHQPVEYAKSGKDPRTISFGNERDYQPLLPTEDSYDDWTIRMGRLDKKESKEYPEGVYGFVATVPTQTLIIEAAPHSTQNFEPIATNLVESFGFKSYTNLLYRCSDVDIRVSTGGRYGDGGCDVTVDDFVVRQWRGEDYDDENNPDYLNSVFYQVGYGAPTNFVYTTGWKDAYHRIEFVPMRTTVDLPVSVRSPLMDGGNNRGLGLGSFSFGYHNADSRARLIVQIATNNVDITGLADLTKRFDGWETVKVISFDEMSDSELAGGVISCYVGIHGVTGVMRVVLDPTLVAESQDPAYNPTRDPSYGSVYLTSAAARDNPSLDTGCWWGWNIRTTDDGTKQLLKDGSKSDPASVGMSFAINNSVTDDVRQDESDLYPEHKPFLQTPVFTSPVVGEISFKARKYSANDPAPTVAIYGTTAYGTVTEDSEFTYLGEVLVTSQRYETYSFQAPPNANYTCFRLAVTGVDGVWGDGTGDGAGPLPESGDVERVLIDELSVFEAIRARIGFRNVGAFRTNLSDNNYVPNVPSASQQPLCNESWGVQTELYVAQLSDTVDYERTPKVILHWYEGSYPWGYDKWAGQSGSKSAELKPCDGTNLIYRSSYIAASEAVVSPSIDPGTVVQYSLEVVYYMKDTDVPLTNRLTAADWVKPSWYNPVDYNAERGEGKYFAAYNILDTVAPKWSWINEVNIFGTYDSDYVNSDADYQYVEVAVPSEADISGWSLRMLLAETSSNYVRTNTVAVFGTDLDGMKPDLLGMASGMVFRVIASPNSTGKLSKKDGTLDGTWSFDNPDYMTFSSDGTISELNPFGIQLVRGSGIVEHEIVVIGTNFWSGSILEEFNPTNTANFLNRNMKDANFFYAGDDDHGTKCSLSVYDSRGEASNFWDRVMIHTPGRINTYADGTPQNIDPDHPTPYGTSILVYCNLGDEHIVQTVGDAVDSDKSQIVVIQRGSARGTNITYRLDKWYDLGKVTTNGVEFAEREQKSTDTWQVTVGVGASNNITVVANSTVCKQLRYLGVDENNKYRNAILDWFTRSMDMYGNYWPDSDGKLHLCDFVSLSGAVVTNLSLTQMYCLDICPTIPNQVFVGGMIKPALPYESTTAALGLNGYKGDETVTNRRMRVFMMVSNRTDSVTYKPYSPYVIRGVGIGETSWDYTNSVAAKQPYNWTNVTFKISGILANGLTREDNPNNWVPQRWFVFTPDSFYQPYDAEVIADPERLFTSDVEVADPFVQGTPGYEAWGTWVEEWAKKHPGEKLPDVFYRWELDERQRFYEIEILKKNNFYK